MWLKCIYRDTLVGDKKWVDLVTHEEFDNGLVKEHNDRINGHEDKIDRHDKAIRNHDASIVGITRTVNQHTNRIQGIEATVNNMPKIVKDSMLSVLNDMFAEKLEWLERELCNLRVERNQMAEELSELRNRLDGKQVVE